MRIQQLPIREVVADADRWPDGWPFTLAPVAQLLRDRLELGPLTILVGENGVGKSTIVEAIALAFGLNPEGGSTGAQNRTRESESPLHEALRLVRGAGASKRGYFLRAETIHGLLTYLEENPPLHGEQHFHELSHGQAFNQLLDSRLVQMRNAGLLVLDEPEAGLSFTSQVALAQTLGQLARDGMQLLVATHSPVVAAAPGAKLLQLDEQGMAPVDWWDLGQAEHLRRFLADPTRYGIDVRGWDAPGLTRS
ncbi:putative ATPase [Luteococcus japonicus]|uniref:Putative ABC transporter n=2 Tax=Luteococcus japonicus TaxID=33984 RepID=A0A1R4I960_9ACTN|nr:MULTISPECIES: AAA family ATPase [Luteococcus]MDN5562884.1 AAA family ATPase [Luteococcus sp.]ROR55309.1 putative ATPase [Luteococcus japonicus]SJN16226.1 putative ABC transporter [Luteococcus japonicus LSP_Lj1]